MRFNTALFHHFRPSLLYEHRSLSHRNRLSLGIHGLHPRDRQAVDLNERNIADSSISGVMTKMVAVTRGYRWLMMKHQMNCPVSEYWHHGLTRLASDLKKNKTILKWDYPKSIKKSFLPVYKSPPPLRKNRPDFFKVISWFYYPIVTSFKNHDVEILVLRYLYRLFSHDVTEAILVSQNNETAAMLVSQTNPVGVKLFSYVKAFFCSINLHRCWSREWKHSIWCE